MANEAELFRDRSFEEAGRLRVTFDEDAERYDRAESIAGAVVKRADSAKSLWTAIVGTLWQPVWAVAGFVIGLPRVVWLTAAVLGTDLRNVLR